MSIHSTAIIGEGANIADDAQIGPYAIIEDGVTIGPGVKILAHAYIASGTEIGACSEVHMYAVIGHLPQDLAFKGVRSYVKIGERNVIREYVSIHRGTKEDSVTVIGNDNFIMANAHLAHNVKIGNNVVIANATVLAGYVEVEDNAFISAHIAIHQFCRIGRLSMLGGCARTTKDVPPYMMLEGDTMIRAMNVVGMRRAGLSQEARNNIKKAYKILYHSGLNVSNAVKEIERSQLGPEVDHLVKFIKVSKRGICPHY